MRLAPLCTIELQFNGPFDEVRTAQLDGRSYGTGSGRVVGPRLAGAFRWTNHPRIRVDGTSLPDLYGAIVDSEGRTVLVCMHGVSRLLADGVRRDTRAAATFVAAADEYAWLNDVFCVCEGEYDTLTGECRFEMHECVNELTS
jgi:hypothetical protein